MTDRMYRLSHKLISEDYFLIGTRSRVCLSRIACWILNNIIISLLHSLRFFFNDHACTVPTASTSCHCDCQPACQRHDFSNVLQENLAKKADVQTLAEAPCCSLARMRKRRSYSKGDNADRFLSARVSSAARTAFTDQNTAPGVSNSVRTAYARVGESVRTSPKSVRVYAQFVRNREHWSGDVFHIWTEILLIHYTQISFARV